MNLAAFGGWLLRVAASAAVRRVVYIAIAALLGLFAMSGKAQAQEFAGCYDYAVGIAECPNRQVALEQAIAHAATKCAAVASGCFNPNVETDVSVPLRYRVKYCYGEGGAGCAWGPSRTWVDECPVDQEWHAPTSQCIQKCESYPEYYAGVFQSASAGMKQCNRGCVYALKPEGTKLRVDGPATSIFHGRGLMAPTGARCEVEPDVPERGIEGDQSCSEVAGGYEVCIDNRGRQCVKSPASGRRYCAMLGDAQNATNPNRTENVKKSVLSPTPTDPGKPENRQGEDWQTTTTVTTTDVTNNTSTTTNINGNAGTPNTNPGSEVPEDGSGDNGTPGDGEGEEGEEEGDTGDVAGGASCANPPTPVGDVKQMDYAQALRDWTSLCEGMQDLGPEFEAAYAGADDALDYLQTEGIFDGGLLSGIEGAWATKVNEMLSNDSLHPTGGDGENSFRSTEEIKFDELDDSGFLGGGSCPALPSVTVEGIAMAFPMEEACTFFGRIGLLVEALAYIFAARILTGSK